MTLQSKTLLMVTTLLVVAVFAASVVLTLVSGHAIKTEAERDGLLVAKLLSKSVEFAEQIPAGVEDAIGEQMVVEATIAAHMVDIAESSGMKQAEIIKRLRRITEGTALEEFWITDEKGHAYLRNKAEIDFTFSPDPAKQPQAHAFWPLLKREKSQVVQRATKREVDNEVYKYVGVGGVDKPRIVQVGYNARYLEALREQVGLERLIKELVKGGDINSIRVVDGALNTIAYGGVSSVAPEISDMDARRLKSALDGKTINVVEGHILKMLVPIDAGETGKGAMLIELPTEYVKALKRNLISASVVTAIVLVIGLIASTILSRRVTGPVTALTEAAADVEAQKFSPEKLDKVAVRKDELGKLARVFQGMVREVKSREDEMKSQIRDLHIEIDEAKKSKQVAEVTESDYFQQLKERLDELRSEE